MGVGNHLVHGDVGHWHKRAYVGCTETGVCAVVLAHVDEFLRSFHGAKCGLNHLVGRTHKGNHGAVGGFAWIHIDELAALNGLYLIGNLLDDAHIYSLGEIGHALYKLLIARHICKYVIKKCSVFGTCAYFATL